ncbi:MAG: CapA family protein, partial [Rubrobacteridae bacterium]|nr:CapA family protein [Rubrobacteridae bacterium]
MQNGKAGRPKRRNGSLNNNFSQRFLILLAGILVVAAVLFIVTAAKDSNKDTGSLSANLPALSTSPAVDIKPSSTAARKLGSQNVVLEKTSFTISAVGDVNFGGTVGNVIAGKGADYPFKNVTGILSSTDIAIGNLECALSSRGKAVAGKKFTFRGSPKCGQALKRAGLDLLSIANNHSKDFGSDALIDTTKTLSQAGVGFAGGGANAYSAYQPKIINVPANMPDKTSGTNKSVTSKVAFIAFSDVVP